MFLRALSLAKTPVLLATLVTPIRFFLELAGLPENVIFIIGLLWLTLAFSGYWAIGTHYGLYFDNWIQALVNHIVYGALVQIIPGFLLGSMMLAIMRYRKSVTK